MPIRFRSQMVWALDSSTRLVLSHADHVYPHPVGSGSLIASLRMLHCELWCSLGCRPCCWVWIKGSAIFLSDRGYSNEPYLLPHGLKATAICYLSSNMSQLNEQPISGGVCVCLCASESARDKPIPVHKSLQGALLQPSCSGAQDQDLIIISISEYNVNFLSWCHTRSTHQ